ASWSPPGLYVAGLIDGRNGGVHPGRITHHVYDRTVAFGRTRGDVHGGTDTLVGAASADVGHRFVDVLVGRLRLLCEERCGGHDLSRVAIAALGNVHRRPRPLHGVRAVRRQAFDRDDLVARFHRADGNRAGALHLAVDVHGACAALRDTAAVFRAGQTDLLADHPQQRCIRFYLHVVDLAIDVERCHELPPMTCVDGEFC